MAVFLRRHSDNKRPPSRTKENRHGDLLQILQTGRSDFCEDVLVERFIGDAAQRNLETQVMFDFPFCLEPVLPFTTGLASSRLADMVGTLADHVWQALNSVVRCVCPV